MAKKFFPSIRQDSPQYSGDGKRVGGIFQKEAEISLQYMV